MTRIITLLVPLLLLTACGKPAPESQTKSDTTASQASKDEHDKALLNAVNRPLERAKSVQATLDAEKEKMDKTLDAQESGDQDPQQ